MIRRIFLLAQREYLTYVRSWGFWLSIFSLPAIVLLGMSVGYMGGSSSPHLALVDKTGVYEAELAPFLNKYPRFHLVPAPAETLDDLIPYLKGEKQINTRHGPEKLDALIMIDKHEEGGIQVAYWGEKPADQIFKTFIDQNLVKADYDRFLEQFSIKAEDSKNIKDKAPKLVSYQIGDYGTKEEGKAQKSKIPFISALPSIALCVLILAAASLLLTSVIEEKNAKIMELLLSSARFTDILYGKLFGVIFVVGTALFLTFTLFSVMIVIIGGTLISFDSSSFLSSQESLKSFADLKAALPFDSLIEPGFILLSLLYFVLGYILYGALFLSIGAQCDTNQEAQTFLSPFLTMLPLFLTYMMMTGSDGMFMRVLSWIPLFTPFIMMARLIEGGVPLWEILVTTVLLALSIGGILALASFSFKYSILGSGGWRNLWRLFRKKLNRGEA